MFDPASAGAGKAQQRRLVGWATEALPSVVRSAVAAAPDHCRVSVREVNCTDPDCAPIDTCFIFVFGNGRECVAAAPGAFGDVSREDAYHAVLSRRKVLVACHEDRPPPPPPPRAAGLPDDPWFYASFGCVTALCVTRAPRWRGPEDALAAAACAAGGSLCLYAAGLFAARYFSRWRRRRRGAAVAAPGAATARGKRAKYTEFGHRVLKGCPCCDPSFEDGL